MAITHNRVDLALVSTGPTEIVDLGEKGGILNAHVVVEGDSGIADVEGCDTADGTFVTVDSINIPVSGVYRSRIPMDWPRFIRLKATGATLSIRA